MSTPFEPSTKPALATPAGAARKRRRWPWAIGVVVALLAGAGLGYAVLPPQVVTKEVPGPVPQAKLDELAQWGQSLQERQEDMDLRQQELDERGRRLDEREAAVSQHEQTIAAGTVSDGIWVVGVDVEPGAYRATNVSADCYWGIYRSGSNGSDIVQNGIPWGGNPVVTLSPGQDFKSQRCGDWHKQ